MKLERTGADAFLLTDGAGTSVPLTRANYEDVFYCVPIDNPSLYLLINDTILDDTEARKAFKKLVDDGGGMDKSLGDLQEQVKALDPGSPFGPPPPPPAPKPEIIEIAPEKPRKPTATIKVAPVVTAPVVSKPATPPIAPPPPAKTAGIPTPRPAVPAPTAPPPAAKTAGIPTPRPAAPAAAAPPKPGAATPPKPASTPVAPAVPPAALKAPSPPSGVKKPSAVLPAVQAPAKTTTGKPSGIIRPAAKPATAAGPMPFKPAEVTAAVVVTKSPGGAWQVAFQGLGVTLTPEKYEVLFNSLPMNTGALFSLLFTNVLQGAENKATFRDMIKKGGAMKNFLDMFQKEVQKVSPHK